ncbi:3-isopropylmalate dehydrogenase [Steroidobacter denitrificans]|uniref:Cytokinin riboside 5'-monophosphate phosphoribohydrolase n=1 Tax=Steroidobacter denitrificans TaxID=465721 RepID=A0A127FB41_STEDE|nr:3-isopropylmalate dehydrogenase [Steroidobacter denitrificans]
MGTPPDSRQQLCSPSYLLPVQDTEFLLRDEMRATRFALEYAKADLLLKDWGIRSTIIVFGSARVRSQQEAQAAVAAARDEQERKIAARWQRQARWYEAAREFGRIASERGGALAPQHRWRDNVIATGGGPGIMEAANRGAREAGAPTIGFNITLPQEQIPNAYSTPALTFQFHYFAMRKMHLAMRANALAIFPGGFGTMDELFEILTLCQTSKAPSVPIVLVDQAYWRSLVNFDVLVEEGMVSAADLALFDFAESAEEAWEILTRRGLRAHTHNGARSRGE